MSKVHTSTLIFSGIVAVAFVALNLIDYGGTIFSGGILHAKGFPLAYYKANATFNGVDWDFDKIQEWYYSISLLVDIILGITITGISALLCEKLFTP